MFPCAAAGITGKLKHSYLENTLLLITHPADLLEALDQVEGERTRKEEIEALFRQLMEILGSAENGFSPAQMVDRLAPFRKLSKEERARIHEALHDYYRREFKPRKVRESIEKIGARFFVVLDEFIRDARKDALDAMTIVSLGALRDLAKELHAAIDKLPKGVWLWEG